MRIIWNQKNGKQPLTHKTSCYIFSFQAHHDPSKLASSYFREHICGMRHFVDISSHIPGLVYPDITRSHSLPSLIPIKLLQN
jgi:hypothetical protein